MVSKMKFLPVLLGLAVMIAGCGGSESSPQTAPPAQQAESPAGIEVPVDTPNVSVSDFEPVLGNGWMGELVYAAPDTEIGQRTVPAQLSISRDGRVLTLDFAFPEAPEGDGSATLEISEEGAWINDERVIRREEEDGVLTLLTRQDCIEGRTIATCDYLYDVAGDTFSIAKAVTLAGESEKRFGHQYSFRRGEASDRTSD